MPNRAASQIWPHLPTQKVEPPPQRQPTSKLAEAMFPNQTPRAKEQQRRHEQFKADLRKLAEEIRRSR
jgi:hypothetical protein